MSACYKASKVRVLHCIDTGKATKYNPFHIPVVSSLLVLLQSKTVSTAKTYTAKLFSIGL